MNITQITDFQELVRNQIIEANPLSAIAIASLNKIIQNFTISKEKKLKMIIEFNYSFALIHHCLLTSRNNGKIQDIDYIFMLLQLGDWYKVNSVGA